MTRRSALVPRQPDRAGHPPNWSQLLLSCATLNTLPSVTGSTPVIVPYTSSVPVHGPNRRRPKVTATLDPDLLAAVDAHVAAHPELDRSAVLDQALRLWQARELERAMQAQFAASDGVDPAERQAWDALRQAAASRQFGRHDPA